MPLQRVVHRDALAKSRSRWSTRAAGPAPGPQAAPPARHPDLRAAPPAPPRPRRCCRTSRAHEHHDAKSAISSVVPRRTRRRASIRNRSNDPETCRQSSIAQTRSPPRRRAQINNAAKPLAPTWTVCSPITSPVVADSATIVCERLWASAPSTIIDLRSPPPRLGGSPADTACCGRCHAPIKSRRTSRTGDERHSEVAQAPNGPTACKESQLAAGPGPSSPRRTSPTAPITTASLQARAGRLCLGASATAFLRRGVPCRWQPCHVFVSAAELSRAFYVEVVLPLLSDQRTAPRFWAGARTFLAMTRSARPITDGGHACSCSSMTRRRSRRCSGRCRRGCR